MHSTVSGNTEQGNCIKYINDSGLSTAKNKLAYLKTIKFVNLNKKDVVRHKIVSEIISAYEK